MRCSDGELSSARVPRDAIASGRTSCLGQRASSSAATLGRAPCSAQTTTDGPGARQRHAGRAGDGLLAQLVRAAARPASRYGSCSRSWKAAREQLRRRRRRSPRRAAPPAAGGRGGLVVAERLGQRALRDCSRARRARRERRAIGGERQVGRRSARADAAAVAPDQADAAVQRGGEVVGVALERQPELEQLVGRGVAPGRGGAGDEPGGDRRGADEPSPRSSGIRLTKRKRWPSSGATSANARSARCVASRGSSSAPSPSSVTSGSPSASTTSSSFQRSSAAAGAVEARARGWPSSPARGPRIAAHAQHLGEDRLERRVDASTARYGACGRPRPCP